MDPTALSPVLNVSQGTKDNQGNCIANLPLVFGSQYFGWQFLRHPRCSNASSSNLSEKENSYSLCYLYQGRYLVLRHFGKQISILESKFIISWASLSEDI